MAGVELATAYYSLLPSMKGTAAAVTAATGTLNAAGAQAGTATGAAMGGGLVASFGKAIPILGGLLLGAGIVDVFKDSIAAASDLSESTNAVRVSFGDLASEVDALASGAATRLGLSANEFNALATQFSGFAGTIAGDGGDVVGVLDELTTRGADFASVFNLDASEALRLFQSGLAGETEPLRRFGIDLSAASVEAYALANGIGDGTGALTEQEKVQARYGSLLAQTSKTQGDFANTSDGFANSQRILAARLEDVRAKLGEALLPAAEKFTAVFLERGIPLLERLVDLFITLEPAISGTADALIFMAENGMLGQLATILDFFNALEDGKITVQELEGILLAMPNGLQTAMVGIINFLAGVTAPWIDAVNTIIGGVESLYNAIGSLSGSSISLPRLPQLLGISVGGDGGSGGRGLLMAADGAYVPRIAGGTVIGVGEGRTDEAVIPMRDSTLQEIGAGIAEASGFGGQPVVLQVLLNDRVLAEAVYNHDRSLR